jgi:hypothetical protein
VVCDSRRERTKSLEREKVFHEIIKKKIPPFLRIANSKQKQLIFIIFLIYFYLFS